MTTIRTSLLGRSLAAGLLLLLVLFGIFPLTTTLTGGYPNVGQLSESITSNFVVFWHSRQLDRQGVHTNGSLRVFV